MVSFVGASTTSLTLSWPKASGATWYEIYRSNHENMSYPVLVKKSVGPAATVTGMPGSGPRTRASRRFVRSPPPVARRTP